MKRIAIFLAIAIAAISCMQEETVTPEIKVLTPAEELVLSCEEGIIPVAFNVNVDWKAEIKEAEAQQWCGITPSKGGQPGDNVLNVICIENKGTDNRTATVVIKAMDAVQELVVTQLQKDVLVLTAKKDYDVAYQGDTLKFNVSHNLDLKVKSDVDWIKEVQTKGLVEEARTFIVEPNAGEARTGKITFTADPFEEVITVNQAAWVLEFAIDPAEGKAFEPEGGEHKVKVASNVEYVVTMETNNWLTMTRNGDEYTFKAVANEGLVARDVDVRFAPKSAKHISAAKVVNMSQKAAGAKLNVSASEMRLSYLAQTFELSVEATIDYTVSYKKVVDGEYVDMPAAENWLSHEVSGNVYTFTAFENASWDERSMAVAFTPKDAAYADMVALIPVYQYGYAFKMWSYQIATIEGYDNTQPLRLAFYKDKLLLSNTTKIYVLNPATGEVESTIPLPDGVLAHSLLVDDAGNLLIANHGKGGTEGTGDAAVPITEDMTLYYVADPMNPTLETVLTYNTGSFYCIETGNFRVKGDIRNDALILATVNVSGGNPAVAVIWEVKAGVCGDYVMTNLPYEATSSCTMPLSSDLEDGLLYIGYGGERQLMYAADPVRNPEKDGNKWLDSSTAWTMSYDPLFDSNYDFRAISVAEWKGKKYAGILAGSHFDYCNTTLILLDIDNPEAAEELYRHSGEFDVPRGDSPDKAGEGTWDNLWWTGGGAHSDIVLIPTEEAILMIGADSNYGTITCVAVMK